MHRSVLKLRIQLGCVLALHSLADNSRDCQPFVFVRNGAVILFRCLGEGASGKLMGLPFVWCLPQVQCWALCRTHTVWHIRSRGVLWMYCCCGPCQNTICGSKFQERAPGVGVLAGFPHPSPAVTRVSVSEKMGKHHSAHLGRHFLSPPFPSKGGAWWDRPHSIYGNPVFSTRDHRPVIPTNYVFTGSCGSGSKLERWLVYLFLSTVALYDPHGNILGKLFNQINFTWGFY